MIAGLEPDARGCTAFAADRTSPRLRPPAPAIQCLANDYQWVLGSEQNGTTEAVTAHAPRATPVRMPVRTHGLTHISLAVRDPDRSLRFYSSVFGVKEYYRDDDSIQVQGPGPHDVLAFERTPKLAGQTGGLDHFGFRLVDPKDIDVAVSTVMQAGGRLIRRGEFAPGCPFAYVEDPDGYQIEIWFE
jgi:catechol 2,3-dioxygenase-like lactoylglutathione lyase family enzyme